MFQDAFEKLELEEVATILDRLDSEFEGVQFDPVETTIMAQDIPFYPGYRFLDIADYTVMPERRRYAVYGKDKFIVLNFSNEPIYAFNKELPIELNEDNIADYVRFFFTYVRGRHGRFLISENVDDINWKEEPPPAARKAIGKMVKPITLIKVDDQGIYHLQACMMFKDSLFKSHVEVQPNGRITLKDEELLIEDMPVLDDTFGQ